MWEQVLHIEIEIMTCTFLENTQTQASMSQDLESPDRGKWELNLLPLRTMNQLFIN